MNDSQTSDMDMEMEEPRVQISSQKENLNCDLSGDEGSQCYSEESKPSTSFSPFHNPLRSTPVNTSKHEKNNDDNDSEEEEEDDVDDEEDDGSDFKDVSSFIKLTYFITRMMARYRLNYNIFTSTLPKAVKRPEELGKILKPICGDITPLEARFYIKKTRSISNPKKALITLIRSLLMHEYDD